MDTSTHPRHLRYFPRDKDCDERLSEPIILDDEIDPIPSESPNDLLGEEMSFRLPARKRFLAATPTNRQPPARRRKL